MTLSFPSFIREFIGTTNDGVTHLLDALKAVQLAQTNITGKIKVLSIFFRYFLSGILFVDFLNEPLISLKFYFCWLHFIKGDQKPNDQLTKVGCLGV